MQQKTVFTGSEPTAAFILFVIGLLAAALPAAAQSGVYTPKPGSSERKAIMNTLRVPVEKDLGMRVIFVIAPLTGDFRVLHDWAFVIAEFRHENGDPMGNAYYNASNDSNLVIALLRRVHGRWRIVTHDTGAVDVEWPEWSRQYHAPAAVFPRFPSMKPM